MRAREPGVEAGQRAEETELEPAAGPLSGFRNLASKESREWVASWAWLVHGVIWLVIVAGVPLFVAFSRTVRQPGASAQEVNEVGALMFFVMGAVASVIAVIAKTQGAIIGEKQSGTAAWVLSKPASRKAFVLAKLAVNFRWLLVVTILVPGVVFYAAMPAISNFPPPPLLFAGGIGILALGLFFYLALSLLLGTVFDSRGALAAVVFGFMVGGFMLSNYAPWLTAAFPWLFFEAAHFLFSNAQLHSTGTAAIFATIAWSVLFVVLALRNFDRAEI
ncbi:MAG: ABC transporter permease [Rubrobacter sp.]|nr:ABC transporter permease [Rubrobacter sp.]